MKKIFWLALALGLMISIPSAMAEKFYFYKESGKKLERGARFDSVDIESIRKRFPDFHFYFTLPKMWSYLQLRGNETGYYKKNGLHFSLTAVPHSETSYFISIEYLGVRDEGKSYPLKFDGPKNPVLPGTPEYQLLTPLGQKLEKKRGAFHSIEGKVVSRYELEVTKKDSLMPSFIFEASPFPKTLYLDYKFRIRKEGGPEEVFEGTIPMELASYNVSGWEKMWS